MHSESYDHALSRAAQLCGIEPEFWDIFGNRHLTSRETTQAIVSALGIPVEDLDQLQAGIARLEHADWTQILEPCRVVSVNRQPIRIPIHIPSAQENAAAEVELRLEDGTTEQFTTDLAQQDAIGTMTVNDGRYIRKEIAISQSLPLGYHSVRVLLPDLPAGEMRLIVTPDRAYLPSSLEDGGRSAGVAVTLYGLRSERNWGSGDFRDLRAACEWAAKEVGVGFLALNPLHAIHNRQPYNASPYLPNSIFYQNFIYLDIEALEEFQESPEAQALWRSPGIQEEIRQLRASDYVEYERVQALKLRFLKIAFQWSQTHPDPWRMAQFFVYIEKEGDLLLRFATYCALDEHLHRENPDLWVWTDWPADYQEPTSEKTRAFQAQHSESILFYQYVQWQINRQLNNAQEHARRCGMAIGLYHDLALATDRCGSDLWAHRPFYVSGCRVGSPPDDFSPQGQDWAFPPPNKYRHRADGYRLFADSIRKTCSHGGALRIDHVMRFFRLFWIPDGKTAASGTYVRDHWEDLIRILALESVRNRVLVVGEDLGTVEPEVRENLARYGILSYRLFYFERRSSGAYKDASEYPREALVSSTTHDLPTIAGFWLNEDIEARRRAGLLDDAGYRAQLAERLAEKQKMLDVLWSSGLLPAHVPRNAALIPELTGELHNAIIGFLATTPSMLMVVNQEDLSKEVAQQNLPGTTDQHRNWSRKMKFTLEQLRSDPQALAFVEMFRHWLARSGRA
ncbi:MAG: 4-alpha-glucanotransferase [Bryobacterales bacterium]|nr:4-alpha-glucanotransferase [Bryobacterales bacterium]